MSSHAGLFFRDGRPATVDMLAPAILDLERLGPDGGGAVISGPVAMISRLFRVTPESLSEEQPVTGVSGRVLTWDGRLDNRADLLAQMKNVGSIDISDAALALAAIERWSTDAYWRLLGDWALAGWNPSGHSVVMARDYAGTRPLYYWIDSTRLIWCSELEGLLALLQSLRIPVEIDEAWVAGLFAKGPDPWITPYVGVNVVGPGCYVVVGRDSCTETRHFRFDPELRIKYRHDGEYEEHFRELFRNAVSCRMRSTGPVWAQLSGGFDSSSVACVAHELLRSGSGQAKALEAVSAVYDITPQSDERRFIQAVEKQLGFQSRYFSDTRFPVLGDALQKISSALPYFIDCFAAREQAICDEMLASGARVQLSGEGGDEMLGNVAHGIPHLLDLIHHRRWVAFGRSLARWGTSTRRSGFDLFREVVLASLPMDMQARLDSGDTMKEREFLLTGRFRQRVNFRRLASVDPDHYGFDEPSAAIRSRGLASVVRRVAWSPFRHLSPVEVGYPILDRRLVAFLLTIPMEQLARPGESRSLQKRALRACLPPEVLNRRSKRNPSAALYRGLLTYWSDWEPLLKEPLAVELGFVDGAQLVRAADTVRSGVFPATLFATFLLVEKWLRRIHNHRLMSGQATLPATRALQAIA